MTAARSRAASLGPPSLALLAAMAMIAASDPVLHLPSFGEERKLPGSLKTKRPLRRRSANMRKHARIRKWSMRPTVPDTIVFRRHMPDFPSWLD